MNGLRTALYCRLSKDDEKVDENGVARKNDTDSESIKTQKAMLGQYAAEHGFIVVGVYVDDGWSGLYFDRPDFQRMIGDIEAGKIDIVITKDLSRLGRDHLQVGHYTEIYFPMKNVRYIAINDNVDTASRNNDIAAIKNVMNEFYAGIIPGRSNPLSGQERRRDFTGRRLILSVTENPPKTRTSSSLTMKRLGL